jgi:hypothetical protein
LNLTGQYERAAASPANMSWCAADRRT